MNHIPKILCILSLTILSAQAATLYGDTVTCAITGTGSFTCNQASAVAGSGVEFTFGSTGGTQFFSVDFEPNDVLLTVLVSNSLGGTILNFTDTSHAFTTESLVSSSGVNGFTASKVSLTAGNLIINLNGTSSNPDATIDVGLNTPEPGSLGLVGAGLMLGMLWVARRKMLTGIILLLPAAGWAAINSCPPLQTSGNVGYPGVGPNNAVYNPGGTTFTGCQVVDATFSAWDTFNTGGTYIGSAITAGQSNDSLITTPTFRLATERGDFSVRTDADNNDGNNDWSTASNNLVGGTVDFVATTSTHPIFEISYVFNGVVHGTGGTVGITPIFCLGGTATDSFTAATCISGGGTPYSPGLTSIVGNGTQSLNFLLPAASSRVAVSFAVNLTAGSAGSAGFNYIDLSFDEAAPEPSTFFFFGAALAVLVGLRAQRARLLAFAAVR